MVKKTTEQFIIDAKKIHGNKYDYDLVDYKNNITKIKIKCLEHGVFQQTPVSHLKGGCPKCGFKQIGLKKKSSSTDFILKAINVHGSKYDYSLVEYKGGNSKVTIICPEHGVFEQTSGGHLQGRGCKECSNLRINGSLQERIENFLNKSRDRHKGKYDYSLVDYKGSQTKVKIICSNHGVFEQAPFSHVKGAGCNKCAVESTSSKQRFSNEDFISKSNLIHGKKYDYKLVDYKNQASKVKIICPTHGIFEQRASNHIKGIGCNKCGIEEAASKQRFSTETFISKARLIHSDRYDYSLVDYKGQPSRVKIICKEHGVFVQLPGHHLKGHGCWTCAREIFGQSQRHDTEIFISKAKLIHGDKYDYSLVDYVLDRLPVIIICKEHGEFSMKPNNHLNGRSGCAKCNPNRYSQVELSLLDELTLKLNETISSQYRPSWLKTSKTSGQSLDMFLEDHNIGIEYQGRHHFEPVKQFGGVKHFKETRERDERKYRLCYENDCKLFYFSYKISYVPKNYPHKVYNKVDELIEAINSHINCNLN